LIWGASVLWRSTGKPLSGGVRFAVEGVRVEENKARAVIREDLLTARLVHAIDKKRFHRSAVRVMRELVRIG
jgi:hypothetical protein